jgi:hypothetical protein
MVRAMTSSGFLRVLSLSVFVSVGVLWLASGTQKERPVVVLTPQTERVRSLETEMALAPSEVTLRTLAQAYLDIRVPGLAVSLIEDAPESLRSEPLTLHLYARALVDQGHNGKALVIERGVLDLCAARPCDAWLVASATRRASILEELVAQGIDDARAFPEASRRAYRSATRQVTLAAPSE